jgi:site-specific DNA recombinase
VDNEPWCRQGRCEEIRQRIDAIHTRIGELSKGERNRIKIRVCTALAAQAQLEGRFLGGRPPYGYRLADAGPHPNPAKAADGKRLHRLEIDPDTAEVVRIIFASFASGKGIFAHRLGPDPRRHPVAVRS